MADTIGRLFVEISTDARKLNQGIAEMIKSLGEADAKTQSFGERLSKNLERALNPTLALEKQIKALGQAGGDVGSFIQVYNDKIIKAAETARSAGKPISDLFQQVEKSARTFQTSGMSIEDIGKRITEFARSPIQAAKTGIGDLLTMLGPTAVGIGAIGTAAVTAAVGIAKLGENLAETAVSLRNQAMAAGLTAQEFQAFNRIGVETGVNTGSLARMLGMLNRELGTGTKMDFVKVLNALREEAGEGAADISRGVIPVLDDLGKRLAAIEDPARRAELVNAAFNRRLQELGVLTTLTKGHLQDYVRTIIEAGAAYGPETQENLLKWKGILNELGRWWEATKIKAIEYFVYVADQLTKLPTTAAGWASRERAPAQAGEWEGSTNIEWAGSVGQMGKTKDESALAAQKRGLELAKLIHDGTKANLEVLLQLAEAEEKYNAAVQEGSVANAKYWAQKVAGIKEYLDALKDAKTKEKEQQKILEEVLSNIDHAITRSRLEQLRLQQQAVTAITPNTELERQQIEIEKVHLAYAIKAEEIRVKYAQLRADLEEKISKLPEKMAAQAEAQIPKLEAALREEMLGLDKDEAAEILKATIEARKKALIEFDAIQKSINRETTQSKIEELRLQQEIVNATIPLNERDRERIEMEKVHLNFAIRAEEIRVKYAQMRAEIEDRIAKNLPEGLLGSKDITITGAYGLQALVAGLSGSLRRQALEELAKIGEKLNAELATLGRAEGAEIIKVHRQEYLRMVATIREGAGDVFDAMVSRGKEAFANLADWIEGVFLTRLKVIFQNLVQAIFAPQPGKNFLSQIFENVLPRGMNWASLSKAIPGLGAIGGFLGLGGTAMAAPVVGSVAEYGSIMGAIQAGNPLVAAYAAPAAYTAPAATLPATGGGMAVGGMAGAGMIAGGGLLLLDSMMHNRGWMGVGESAGGGALIGGAIGGWVGAGIGAAIGAIAGLIRRTIKDAWLAGSMEALRDFKVQISEADFKGFATALGLSEDKTYGIRKDLESSPKFLKEVLWPLAQAQGKTEEFLASLEKVSTSWGTFNFRAAFELGTTTGDWAQLNRLFELAFKNSAALVGILPDFAEKLKAVATAAELVVIALQKDAKSFTDLKTQIQGMITPTLAMFDAFFKMGVITDDFRAKVLEFGGDIEKFQKLADLTKLNLSWQVAIDAWRQTGEILPELRQMFTDFGGDLSVLDDALALPGLKNSLSFIQSLMSQLQSIIPDPIQQLLAGNMSPEVIAALTGAKIDPSKLTGVAAMAKMETTWDKAIQDFQKAGILSADLKQALGQYGGGEGQTALANYAKGFNTVTQSLLDTTKAALDQAYQKEVKDALAYLATIQQTTSDKITALQNAVENQFTIVGGNITKAMSDAATDLVKEIDLILDAINVRIVTPLAIPGGGGGGGGEYIEPGTEENPNKPPPHEDIPTADEVRPPATPPRVYVDMRGSTFLGMDDLDRKLEDSLNRTLARRGYGDIQTAFAR